MRDHFCRLSVQVIDTLRLLREGRLGNASNACSILKDIPGSVIIPSSLELLRTFEEELDLSKSKEDPHAICSEYLLLVGHSLQERWRSTFKIALNVELCKGQLQQIESGAGFNVLRHLFQTVICVIQELHRSNKEISFSKSSSVVLCLHQIKSSLPFLLSACKQGSTYVIKYTSKCLSDCLECIAKEVCERTELPCSEFLDLMDCVLSALESGRPSLVQLEEVQEQVEELLCHAMATAQVAITEEDKERIKAKSQVVLNSLKILKEAVAEEDLKQVGLSSDVMSDALCEMERSVNNAVLRLVLDVCSGVQDPVRKLVDRCKPDDVTILTERQASDLNDDIINFDVFMDRLMQVGTFAVSCSSNIRKAMQLRSCLATFESLESEVVPCVTSLYLDASKANKTTVRLLLERWQNEINLYHKLLSSIVDPPAYVHIVLSYLKEQKEALENSDDFLSKITNMTKAARSLQPVILTTFEQDALENSSVIKVHSDKINKVVMGCLKLLDETVTGNKDHQKEKVKLKTSNLVMEVEYLWEALARQLLAPETSMESIGFETSFAKDYYKLCVSDGTATDLGNLTPIAARGLRMVKEEAVLYNTPKRSAVKRSAMKTPAPRSTIKKNIPPSTVRSRCFRTPAANRTEPQVESMELTHLLEELTKLDDTFSNSTIVQSQKDPLHGKQLLQLFENWDMSVCSILDSKEVIRTAVGSSLDSHSVGSLERMRDLELVQDKIATLKASDDQYVTVINIP